MHDRAWEEFDDRLSRSFGGDTLDTVDDVAALDDYPWSDQLRVALRAGDIGVLRGGVSGFVAVSDRGQEDPSVDRIP